MIFTYETIKKLAKETGRRPEELIVLTEGNDPFYCGKKADVIKAEWFQKLWHATGYLKAHLRKVHYWAISPKTKIKLPSTISTKSKITKKKIFLDTYVHDENGRCWAFLQEASKYARYLGLVPFDAIDDAKNPEPHINTYYFSDYPSYSIDIPELNNPTIDIHGLTGTQLQPYHLEVWCEKSTMDNVLLPICEKYHTNLVTFTGETTISRVINDLIRRIDESGRKPTRIFYISDFDPAGNSMPCAAARKLEWFLRNNTNGEYDVRLNPIALTEVQVERYNLPRMPIEKDIRRAGNFEKAFGEGACELDALEVIYPGKLAEIVDETLSEYYDQDIADESEQNERDLEAGLESQIEEITSKYQSQIKALEKMYEEIENIEEDVNGYVTAPSDFKAEESNDWLFDSKREYMEQLKYYKKHKGEREV